jgi:hypothetical protein
MLGFEGHKDMFKLCGKEFLAILHNHHFPKLNIKEWDALALRIHRLKGFNYILPELYMSNTHIARDPMLLSKQMDFTRRLHVSSPPCLVRDAMQSVFVVLPPALGS